MFTDDVIVYVENLKINNRQKILLELISDYSKVARCKVNTQKSTAFLYADNEPVEFDI